MTGHRAKYEFGSQIQDFPNSNCRLGLLESWICVWFAQNYMVITRFRCSKPAMGVTATRFLLLLPGFETRMFPLFRCA